MSVKAILQGQNDKTPKLHVETTKLPKQPSSPIAAGEEMPWSWAEINAIALSGNAESYFSLGSLKECNLSTAVLGSTNPKMMVIGINQDADGTITFQTQNCLNEATAFGSSAQWIGSTVRQLCQRFYIACEARNFIKIVSKGVCPNASTGSNRNDNVIYNDETVWLPSEREMGLDYYSPLSVANSSTSKAECTQGKNFTYSYYSNSSNRIKKQGNSSSSYPYWDRSRSTSTSTSVCMVYGGGAASGNGSGGDGGLAPAFVIGVSNKPTLIQDNKDVTNEVKEAINAADKDELDSHISDTTMHTTTEEKSKIANAVTSSGVVLNEKVSSALPDKPSSPIAVDAEIPWTWKQINAITCAGKATEYFSVGSLKKCTLINAVLGSTEPMMRVIGIGQDADNTVTFQTQNCLNNQTSFGNSAQWVGSTARNLCQNFYNTCEAKPYIKIVSKGTCSNISDTRNANVTYNDETVWLPSEQEMGLDEKSPLSIANSSTTNAECTYGKNFSYAYYTNDNSRIKKLGDNSDSRIWYWERSRYYPSNVAVAGVSSNGYAGYSNNQTVDGLAPAFVIGNPSAVTGSPHYTLTQDSIDVTGKVSQVLRQVNPNLLDNWYFPRPVNQRGQTEYIGATYTIDRWQANQDGSHDMTVTIAENGVIIKGDTTSTWSNWSEKIDPTIANNLIGQQITFTVLCLNPENISQIFIEGDLHSTMERDNGLFTFTYTPTQEITQCGVQVQQNKSAIIIAAKLELGGMQTLAHKDEYGNWVLNEIPDYGEQLRRCQRYYYQAFYAQYQTINMAYEDAGYAFIMLPLPVEMRIKNPVLTQSAPIALGSSEKTLVGAEAAGCMARLAINYSAISNAAGSCYSYCPSAEGVTFKLSADL